MSTLPFLLSVADELDNLNSQSYMDDFGLGFHPHRQYYRTPTIQLSLPASTDWMENERSQRYRSHKFVFETQNNLTATAEGDETDATDEAGNGGGGGGGRSTGGALDAGAGGMGGADNAYTDRYGSGASTSAASRQKYTSLLNSNDEGGNKSGGGLGKGKGKRGDEADTIDNTVQMYNLSKKCCKNYYRRGDEPTSAALAAKGKSAEGSYRLHAKCMEGANSSSDESLQKPTSSIEFLTCFLVKKSRTPKGAGISGGSGSGKKSS